MDPGIELWLPGLMASTFTHGALLPAQCSFHDKLRSDNLLPPSPMGKPDLQGEVAFSCSPYISYPLKWQMGCCFYSVLSYFCQGSDEVLCCVRAWQSGWKVKVNFSFCSCNFSVNMYFCQRRFLKNQNSNEEGKTKEEKQFRWENDQSRTQDMILNITSIEQIRKWV